MLGKKKPRLGFQPKQRTKQEIDQEYTHHAVQIGHKARVISQLEDEVAEHIAKLVQINKEAMTLPPEPVAAAPVAEPETSSPPADQL